MATAREPIDSLTAILNSLSDDARDRLARDLAAIDWSDIAAARDAVIEIMNAYLGAYTDMAAQATALFYEQYRALQTGGTFAAVAESGRKREATEQAVRALMRFAADGDSQKTVDALIQRADYEIKRAAGECVLANVRRDPAKPKFARVPTGAETCQFCMMLASRGFVYSSKTSAGLLNHYHAGCDCRVVPKWGRGGIAGYYPDEWHAKWKQSMEDEATARAERNGTEWRDEYSKIQQRYRESAKNRTRQSSFAATGNGLAFSNYNDVRDFIYAAKSQRDLESRYSQLVNIYGGRSEQMQSQRIKSALRHMEKQLGK